MHRFIKIVKSLASTALEVEGTMAESTALSSSIEILVDASVLLESLKLVDSMNCFREDCMILLPEANTCPLILLQSVPNKLSCGDIVYSFVLFETRVLQKKGEKQFLENRQCQRANRVLRKQQC